MAHPRHEEETAPLDNLFCAAVRGSQGLVIAQRVQRRKPRIAVAVKEDELAAASGEGGKIRRCGLNERIGGMQSFLVDVDFHRCWVKTKEAPGAQVQQTWYGSAGRNSGIVKEA